MSIWDWGGGVFRSASVTDQKAVVLRAPNRLAAGRTLPFRANGDRWTDNTPTRSGLHMVKHTLTVRKKLQLTLQAFTPSYTCTQTSYPQSSRPRRTTLASLPLLGKPGCTTRAASVLRRQAKALAAQSPSAHLFWSKRYRHSLP